jgi:hypothetical protein
MFVATITHPVYRLGAVDSKEDRALSGWVPDRLAVRLPWGLLGMLALVLTAEASITSLRDDLVRPLGESWRFAAQAAETQAAGCDVLCFGDSLVKYGVLPKVIESRTGLRAYGLACSGGTTPSAFFLLRRALDSGARPKAVVVDFTALLPVIDASPGLLNYPELATCRDCFDLAWESNDPSFFGTSMVAKLIPSSRLRFEIRNSIRTALNGWNTSERASVTSHRLIWARERGAQPTEPGRARHPQEALLIEGLCPEGWVCPSRDKAYINRFLDLAASRGITVYWLLPPLAPEVHARRTVRGSDAAYERFVRAVAAKYPNTVVLDARNSGYDDSVHADYLHLDRRGATVLSNDLAAILVDRSMARSEGDRVWVALPYLAGRSGDELAPSVARSQSLDGGRSQGVPR